MNLIKCEFILALNSDSMYCLASRASVQTSCGTVIQRQRTIAQESIHPWKRIRKCCSLCRGSS